MTFAWNRQAFPDRGFPAGKQIGFIAQEVERSLPELVDTDDKGYKTIAYTKLIPILVEAIKSQQRQIDALKTHR